MAVRLTRHARLRARRRRIPIELVLEVYRDPDWVRPSRAADGREIRSRTYDDQVIEIVVDTAEGTVVTAWRRAAP